MKGRALLTTVGATALGLGIVVGGITDSRSRRRDRHTPLRAMPQPWGVMDLQIPWRRLSG